MNKPGFLFARVTILLSDLRLAITLLFAGLICWRTLVDGELPTWLITGCVICLGLVALLFLLEVGLGRYQAWLSVRSFCAMDPVTRDERLERIWPRALRAELMRRVNSEGTMEIDGMVERFPSLATARRAASLGYWLCVCMLCVTLGLVLRFSSALPAVAAIVAWAVIALLLSVARSLRTRSDRLRALLEISPHGIASVAPGGARVSLRWADALRLTRRAWDARWEIASLESSTVIALDDDRVGAERALQSVLRLGGFENEGDRADRNSQR